MPTNRSNPASGTHRESRSCRTSRRATPASRTRSAARRVFAAVALAGASTAALANDLVVPLTPAEDGLTPSPLPLILFDFEDKDDLGVYPFEFRLDGQLDIGEPPIANFTHGGAQGLIVHGGATSRVLFTVPVETVEFFWRDPNQDIKSTVTAYDIHGDIVFRADGRPEIWSLVHHSDPARTVSYLEFRMESTTGFTVVDDLGVAHREAGRTFCAGDGVGSVGCPCNNQSASGAFEGCMNSTGEGARVHALGTAIVERRDLSLYVDGLPAHQPVMLLEGAPTDDYLLFRDGALCLGSLTRRLDVAVADASGTASLGAEIFDGLGAPTAGETRDYQCWYRDPLLSVCGSGSNFSQAQRVDWL